MATSRPKTFTLENINPNIVNVQYAVRGEIPTVAGDYESEIERGQGSKLPFSSIIWTNIGNPQLMPDLAQPPLTFWRQVAALTEYPHLLDAEAMPSEVRDKVFPADAQQRARELLGAFGSVGAYTPSKGTPLVRQRVADFLKRRDGYAEDIENIYLTAGASAGIALLFQLLFRPGQDGVLIPIPQYPLYSATLSLLNVHALHYELDSDQHWDPAMASLEDQVTSARKAGVAPRALVVINPGNPTGACMTLEQIRAVLRFAHKQGLALFADEVYQQNIYQTERPFISFRKALLDLGKSDDPDDRAASAQVELVSLHSISKGVSGECGRRGGYFQLQNMDADVEAQVNKIASVHLCPPTQGQIGVDMLVNPPREGDASYPLWRKETNAIRDTLKRRGEDMAAHFSKLPGVDCERAMGAMYLFPRVHLSKAAWDRAESVGKKVDELYCRELLDLTGICVVPGAGFGKEPQRLPDGTSYSFFRTTMLAKATDQFIERYCDFHREFVAKYHD
ncbi:alanine transaminase [Malassezia sp. CBS 17886]|nr:alanine transaminase [Malassezia sp. CBS 17886]